MTHASDTVCPTSFFVMLECLCDFLPTFKQLKQPRSILALAGLPTEGEWMIAPV